MKKLFILFIFFLSSLAVFAQQNGIFQQQMRQGLINFFYAQTPSDFKMAEDYFVDLSKHNQGSYLPDYYTALVMITETQLPENSWKMDALADSALSHIGAAEVLSPDNVELEVLRGYALMSKVMADPAHRELTYGPIITEHFEKAMRMSPDNPRAIIFLARDMFVHAQYEGSSVTNICAMANTSLDLFKKESHGSYDPSWGQELAEELVQKCK